MIKDITLEQLSGAFVKEFEARLDAGLVLEADWVAQEVISRAEPSLIEALKPVMADRYLLNVAKELNNKVAVSIMNDGSKLSDRDRIKVSSAFEHLSRTISEVETDQKTVGQLLLQGMDNQSIAKFDIGEVGDQFQNIASNRIDSRDPEAPNDRLSRDVEELIRSTGVMDPSMENFHKIQVLSAQYNQRMRALKSPSGTDMGASM